jgi:hypothetical protein
MKTKRRTAEVTADAAVVDRSLWLSPNATAITPVVSRVLWAADTVLSRGKITGRDAAAMRLGRTNLQALSEQLQELLSALPSRDADLIGFVVARLLHNAEEIWYLHPYPTPNVRKTINAERPGHMRRKRAAKPEALAKDEACAAEFTEQLRNLPADWDGKEGVWTIAGRAAKRINANLERQGIEAITQGQIRRRLRDFHEARR